MLSSLGLLNVCPALRLTAATMAFVISVEPTLDPYLRRRRATLCARAMILKRLARAGLPVGVRNEIVKFLAVRLRAAGAVRAYLTLDEQIARINFIN